jgi:WD40 repeat protein/tetratricopeptide (TPR) repeat protein
LSGLRGDATASVALSPDGRQLAEVTGSCIRLWDVPADRSPLPPLPHAGHVVAGAFSPDGGMLTTMSRHTNPRTNRREYESAQRWASSSGAVLGEPLTVAPQNQGQSLATDGRLIAVAAGQSVELRDAATGRTLRTIQPLGQAKGQVHQVHLSRDAAALATACLVPVLPKPAQGPDWQAEYRVWDPATGRPRGPAIVLPPIWNQAAWITVPVLVGPGGRTIVLRRIPLGPDSACEVWDVGTGKRLAGFDYSVEVGVWDFSPDGSLIATGGADGEIRVWSTETRQIHGVMLDRHQRQVRAVAFSADGRSLATGGQDRTARLWDVATGRPFGLPLRHPGPVTAVAFAPDGGRLLTGCADGLARIWHVSGAVAGDASEVKDWVEIVTGQTMGADGSIDTIPDVIWQGRAAGLDRREAEAPAESAGFSAAASPARRRLAWHQRDPLSCLTSTDRQQTLWYLDREIRNRPDDRLAYLLRSVFHVRGSHPDQAEADWQAANRDAAGAALPWCRLLSGWATDRHDDALAEWCLVRLVAGWPNDAAAYLARAELRLRIGEASAEPAPIADDLGRAVEALKHDPELLLEAGRAYAKAGKWDRSAAAFVEALDRLPEGNLQVPHHATCRELARWDESFVRAVKLRPDHAALWVGRGCYLARSSRWPEAADALAKVITSRPPFGDRIVYAGACVLAGDDDNYRAFVNRLAKNGENPARLAVLAEKPPVEPARLIAWARQGLSGDPTSFHVLGAAYYRAGQYERAIEQFALSLRGDWGDHDVQNWLMLAMAHHRLGQADEARKWLDKATTLFDGLTPKVPGQMVGMFEVDWTVASVYRREAERLIMTR